MGGGSHLRDIAENDEERDTRSLMTRDGRAWGINYDPVNLTDGTHQIDVGV